MRGLGFREAADPDTWVTGESVPPVLPPRLVVWLLSGTPPPNMLSDCHLLREGPVLLICGHSAS